MLTEKEKKAFSYLSRLFRSHGVKYVEWSVGSPHEEDMVFNPEHFSTRPYLQNTKHPDIPESIQVDLINWYNREGQQSINDGIDRLYDEAKDDVTYSSAEIRMDLNDNTISTWGFVQWPSQGDSIDIDFPIEDKNEAERIKNEYGISEFTVDYNGGGDSGYVEDTAYFRDGSFQCPEYFQDLIYAQLPGGWEINEGSSGNCEFNLDDMTGIINHTEYYDEEASETFLEENF